MTVTARAESVDRADVAELIGTEVREELLRRGLDPQLDPTSLGTIVDEVLADYGERSLPGGLPPILDHRAMRKAVFDDLGGLGPLQAYLDDPEIEEIWINEPGKVFIARQGRSELTNTVLAERQVRALLERMLAPSGRRVDVSQPFVDALLADGSRLHVVVPDITRKDISINIRKFVVTATALGDLVSLGCLSASAAAFLDAAVVCGLNVLVAGGTQAGKTTMLNCLATAIPARERVVSCEEVFELKLHLPDWVAMQTRQPNLEGVGEIPLRRLVKEALRMRPDRIIVGEVRQAEALDLLVALNSGLPGMATIHANSAREAVTKLCTLPLLAGPNVSDQFTVPAVASSVDVVVHVVKDSRGRRRVSEIVAIPGRVESDVIEVAQIFSSRDGQLVRAEGFPPHLDRFADRGYDLPDILGRPSPAPSTELRGAIEKALRTGTNRADA